MISVDWHYQTFICSTSEKVLANHTLIIGDIIYDNPVNESLINKLEKVQYQACLAITGAIQGTSRESLYKELVIESVQSRQWYRKMVFFNKVFNGLTPIISNDIERQLLKYKS